MLTEVEAFQVRQEQQRLTKTLTSADIEQKVLLGKVVIGGAFLNVGLDPQISIDKALQAFKDRAYFFIDDIQQHKLDSEVLFLRLVPLVGG